MPATFALNQIRPLRSRLTVRGILARLAEADASHRANLHLRALDDRMLRDIGLTRDDAARPGRRAW